MSDRAFLGWARTCLVLASVIAACGSGDDADEPEPERDARTEPEPDAASEPPDSGPGGDAGSGPMEASANEWTMMGGDATNRYFNPAETEISVANAGTLVEKWRFTVAGFPAGSPVIVDGKVFVIATGGLSALDLESGAVLWQSADLRGTATPAYADGFLYVHTTSADLYKLDAETGTSVWGPTHTNDQVGCDGTSSPIVGGDKIVVGHSCGGREVGATAAGSLGGVAAFDLESGEKAWTYFTVAEGEDGAMVWSSVAIDAAGGTVFATTGNNYTVAGENSDAIHAIDLETGASPPKWRTQVRAGDVWSLRVVPGGQDTDFGANPILAEVDGRQVVAAGDKGSAFWMLDRETGERLWGREDLSASHTPSNGGVLMNGAFDGRYFYAVSNDPTAVQAILHKLDPTADGADVWTQSYPKLTWGAPSLANGVLFVPINDDLYVLDAESGEMLTMFNTGGSIAAGAAAIAQGRVIVKSGLNYIFGGTHAIANNQVICYGLP